MRRFLGWLIVAGMALGSDSADAGELRIRLTGVEEAKGTVRVALFASGADYDAGNQVAGYFTVAVASEIEAVFAGLSRGHYGISAFHDVNANGEVDRNLVGIPKEPTGFSRNARGRFGPPKFDDLSVEVGDEPVMLEIELR